MKQLKLEKRELPYEMVEELKNLRTNIQFCGSEKRVLLLTSCLGGEGKSTVSLELARAMADLGKNVLLIDADLRKSALKKRAVEGPLEAGLAHYLTGQCVANDALYRTESSGVYVLPAGATPPNPSELLASKRMQQLIESAKKVYDYVLVDCAPLGMVVDAAVVAPRCDGSILLIESGVVSYRLAQEVLAKLKNTQCPVLGVILNKVDRHGERYYGYGKYGQYYSRKYQQYHD